MSDIAGVLREALLELHDAAEGWLEDNRYERAANAGDAALTALLALVEQQEKALRAGRQYRDRMKQSAGFVKGATDIRVLAADFDAALDAALSGGSDE